MADLGPHARAVAELLADARAHLADVAGRWNPSMPTRTPDLAAARAREAALGEALNAVHRVEQGDHRLAFQRWFRQATGWHGWAVTYAEGVASDVLMRHIPGARQGRLRIECNGCNDHLGNGDDPVDWPCAEYRYAAKQIDFPVEGT